MSHTDTAKDLRVLYRVNAQLPDGSLEANELLSRIIQKLGHQVGNQLTSIISLATIVERIAEVGLGDDPEARLKKLQSYASSIMTEAWRLSQVNENLVALLSNSVGNLRPCELSPLFPACLQKLASRELAKGKTLTLIEHTDRPLHVMIDPEQLRVIVSELLRNAVRAVESGGFSEDSIQVDVRPEGNMAAIIVSNPCSESIEVMREKLAQCAQPLNSFWDGKASLGLGLSVIGAVVGRCKGAIEVELAEDDKRGLLFAVKVSIPLAPEETVSPQPAQKIAPNRTSMSRGLRQLTNLVPDDLPNPLDVIIVEDEPMVASAIQKIIELAFSSKTTCVCSHLSGYEAIQAIEQGRKFDVMLCDLNLSGTSGKHVLESLESHRRAEVGKFAFLTGDNARPDIQAYLNSCGRPHMGKPFEPADLISFVTNLL